MGWTYLTLCRHLRKTWREIPKGLSPLNLTPKPFGYTILGTMGLTLFYCGPRDVPPLVLSTSSFDSVREDRSDRRDPYRCRQVSDSELRTPVCSRDPSSTDRTLLQNPSLVSIHPTTLPLSHFDPQELYQLPPLFFFVCDGTNEKKKKKVNTIPLWSYLYSTLSYVSGAGSLTTTQTPPRTKVQVGCATGQPRIPSDRHRKREDEEKEEVYSQTS